MFPNQEYTIPVVPTVDESSHAGSRSLVCRFRGVRHFNLNISAILRPSLTQNFRGPISMHVGVPRKSTAAFSDRPIKELSDFGLVMLN